MKILKGMKRLALIGFVAGTILLLGIIGWYNLAWPLYVDKAHVIEMAAQVNDTDTLLSKFYDIYDQIYPKHRQTSASRSFFIGGLKYLLTGQEPRELVSPTRYLCHIFLRAYPVSEKLLYKMDYTIHISFAINKYVDAEKSFDFHVNNFDFLYGRVGIDAASQGYFDKRFHDLSLDEVVGLIAMLENPYINNPKISPERHKAKVEELKARMRKE